MYAKSTKVRSETTKGAIGNTTIATNSEVFKASKNKLAPERGEASLKNENSMLPASETNGLNPASVAAESDKQRLVKNRLAAKNAAARRKNGANGDDPETRKLILAGEERLASLDFSEEAGEEVRTRKEDARGSSEGINGMTSSSSSSDSWKFHDFDPETWREQKVVLGEESADPYFV